MVPADLLLDMEFYEYRDHTPQIKLSMLLINGANEYVLNFNYAFDLLNDLVAEKKDLLTLESVPHHVFLGMVVISSHTCSPNER